MRSFFCGCAEASEVLETSEASALDIVGEMKSRVALDPNLGILN